MDDFIANLKDEEIPVFVPGEEEYERSVATSNLLYRFSRPTCVVQPKRASQVQLAIRCAVQLKDALPKDEKIKGQLIIKGGGHSYAGFSTAETGISLDLGANMKKVTLQLDKDRNPDTVTLQGGAQWGHAYKQLVNGGHRGYIINGGRCPTVGVGGFTTGGGLGPFTRTFGMGCDTLLSATIVTAGGELITVSAKDDSKTEEGRLFWALRGAGGGNFGVVVEMTMKVQKLKQTDEGTVTAGRFLWTPKVNAKEPEDLIGTMNKFYTTDWPVETTIDSSWLADLSKKDIQVRFLVYHDGHDKDFDNVIESNIVNKDLRDQLVRKTLPEVSTRFLHETLVSLWSEDIKRAFPQNKTYQIYSSFSFTNDPAVITKITSIIQEELQRFRQVAKGESSGLCQVTFIHSGGAASSIPAHSTAFRWREATYHAYIMIEWTEKYLEKDMLPFLQSFKSRLRPYSLHQTAAFINFADNKLDPASYERAYYGNNATKLREIKRARDKNNFFEWTQGVRLPEVENEEGEDGEKVARTRDEDALAKDVSEGVEADAIAREAWKTVTAYPENAVKPTGDVFTMTDLGY